MRTVCRLVAICAATAFGPLGLSAQTATFITADTSTQGTWIGTYGADGYDIAGGPQSPANGTLSYGSYSIQNESEWTYASSTSDPRALETDIQGDRIAATWYNVGTFSFGVNFTDANTHQVALYLLDWDHQGRAETITVTNYATGAVLDTRSIPNSDTGTVVTNFQSGTYLLWNVSGHVSISITNNAGPNAVVAGIFFGGASSPTAPAVASANSTGFTVGQNGTFTVTASGSPLPALTESGSLPTGVSFTDNHNGTGTLSGNPSTNANSPYQISFTASNGVTPSFTQNFTLTVNPQVVSSGPSATFMNSDTSTQGTWIGTYGADGYDIAGGPQSPANGTLSYGSYSIQNESEWTYASSTSDPRALETDIQGDRIAATWYNVGTFSFGVNFTDANTHQVALYLLDWDHQGRAETITVTNYATGAVLDTRSIPNSDTGTVVTNFQSGTYLLWNVSGHVSISITNNAGPNAVVAGIFFGGASSPTAPAVASANSTGFTVGQNGTFTVTASGSPLPALTESGSLPTGVSFTDNHNGTGTLSGTPVAGSGGNYSLTFTGSNGVGSNAVQTFALTVYQGPAFITGTSTTFVVGTMGTFTPAATGVPVPTITETGTLPSGVSFVNGVLSGAPATETSGNYGLTFTVSNGVGSSVLQNFTFAVDQQPSFSSVTSTTFTVGTSGIFSPAATGFPTPTISETGALPSGVTFMNGLLSGTPAAGTGGSYSLTLTARNGVGSSVQQNFTLTVVSIASGAPLSVVQENTAQYSGPNTSVSVTLNGVTAGNALFVAVAWEGGGGHPASSTVTDGKGDVYTTAIAAHTNSGDSNLQTQSFIATNVGGGNTTITVSFAPYGYEGFYIVALEISGLASFPVDQALNNDSSGFATFSSSVGPVTTTAANEILLGVTATNGNAGLTAGSGYAIPSGGTVGTGSTLGIEYQIVSSEGSYSATMGFNYANWNMGMVTLASAPNTSLTYQFNDVSLTSLQYKGVQYSDSTSGGGIASADRGIPWIETYTRPGGSTYSTGVFSCSDISLSVSGQTVNGTCPVSTFHFSYTYSQPDPNTLKVAYTLYNDSTTDTITQVLIPIAGIILPHPYTSTQTGFGNPVPVAGFVDNFLSWSTAEADTFSTDTSGWYINTQVTANTPTTNYDDLQMVLNNSQVSGNCTYFCQTYNAPIAPSSSYTINYYIRFASPTSARASLLPESISAWNAANPSVLNWTDRRPIAELFFNTNPSGISTTNPGGYFNDPTCCANQAAFNAELQTYINNVFNTVNNFGFPIQGLIVWDLEGEESSALNYVGDPRSLPTLSPMMDAAADSMFAQFRNAGYRVGVTLRGQTFTYGSTVPSGSCTYNDPFGTGADSDAFNASYFASSGTPLSRVYVCQQTSGTSGTWVLGGRQAYWESQSAAAADIIAKATYAYNRWGVTLFYVDSNGWYGDGQWSPQTWATIQAAVPNALFIPEHNDAMQFPYISAYNDSGMFGAYNSAEAGFQIPYPNAFFVSFDNGTSMSVVPQIAAGMCHGDLYGLAGSWNSGEAPVLAAAMTQAATMTGCYGQ